MMRPQVLPGKSLKVLALGCLALVCIGAAVGDLVNAEATIAADTGEAAGPPPASPAEESGKPATLPVEVNGDQVEFRMSESRIIASGNVSVKREGVELFCDNLDYSNATQIAVAAGHVILIRGEERLLGEGMRFNFGTMQGEFTEGDLMALPFYGHGAKILKVGENHMQVHQGYITTCDLDKPHFRFLAKKVDIYPGVKAVSRNVRVMVGKVPVMYIPKFTQDLRRKEPVMTATPGYDKNWGPFLLTQWFYRLSDDIRGKVRLDYRFRKDLAAGLDVDYKTKKYGHGIVRTYYMHERSVAAKLPFRERLEPTIEEQRYKIEWRHQWDIDERTNYISQYSKFSDDAILKDYFVKYFDRDSSPSTFFQVTRGLPAGTMSVRSDIRINRFTSAVERLPEVRYDLPSHKILDSNFYLRNTSTYVNLVQKSASPSDSNINNHRLDLDSDLAYPMKVAFVEVKPFVGGEHTYYNRTVASEDFDSIRGAFRTGADLSTKFYKIYDTYIDWLGLDINRLRHVVTPSVAYLYRHDPTLENTKLLQFDAIDSLSRAHHLNFGLENKWQTKRQNKSYDILRVLVSSAFRLKEEPGKGGFLNVASDIEMRPYPWLAFDVDSDYDTKAERISTINTALGLHNPGDKWYARLEKRWNVDVDDQVTSEFGYIINPLWRFRVYQRYDVERGILKEQEYNLRRDMHEWTMEINFNQRRGEGSEIWVVFTLKAFPEIGFDFGSRFNRRKAGSQLP